MLRSRCTYKKFPSLRGGATVEGVEVDPTPFFSSFNALQCDHPASLDPLTVGIGVKYHPSRRGELDEHSEVVFEYSDLMKIKKGGE